MFFLYGIVLTLAFLLLLPRFIYDAIFNGKYASGFTQRLGYLPPFDRTGGPVIWVHGVSVGEINAARPLVAGLIREFPGHRLIVSTTTRTGQDLARQVFAGSVAAVFYFPFDWKFSVRRALRHFRPSVVLLMETEIWFNFLREANKSGARVAIVNGRLSERSAKRYAYLKQFMQRVLSYPDLALMQTNADAGRIMGLGMRANKVKVTGNLKFDQRSADTNGSVSDDLLERFAFSPDAPLIIAASTHAPEEKQIIEAFRSVWKNSNSSLPRLMIAPRHPERFQAVADEIRKSGFAWARRSEMASARDQTAEIILLDSVGELRAAYPHAEIVFVGGSLIPHGGQSILEPAIEGKAMITGPFTANFAAAVDEFLKHDAVIQLSQTSSENTPKMLADAFTKLLSDQAYRLTLGENARRVMTRNAGAAAKTIELLRPLIAGEAAQ
ncbi:MAG: 3-deoxy-D-manno-octulosonic acid transferase [Acidobacteriota bacterium]